MQRRTFLAGWCTPMLTAMRASGQTPPAPESRPSDRNAIAYQDRAEGSAISFTGEQPPLVEGYFQGLDPDPKVGFMLTDDHYVLGRFKGGGDPKIENLLGQPGFHGSVDGQAAAADQQLLDGLLHAMVPDRGGLTEDRYEFEFMRTVLLGAVQCLVYDVYPRNPSSGPFEGRIYLERRAGNIVRWTGRSERVDELLSPLRHKDSRFRVDSWRMNVRGSLWVPAFAYIEESLPLGAPSGHIVRGQVRYWGYSKITPQEQQQFVKLTLVGSDSTLQTGGVEACAPQQCQRRFEAQAEENVLSRLYHASLLGPPGDVERMLDQVVTNLLVPSKVRLAQPVVCRILLTTPLEAFTAGNTLVVSRGAIDVLPESGIALIVAHHLAHLALGDPRIDSKLAFPEVLRVSDGEILAKLRFRHTAEEEKAADKLAIELVRNSCYGAAMPEAALAMQALQWQGRHLTHLIAPSFGEHVADAAHVVCNDEIARFAGVYDPKDPDQVAGLPLGSKLLVNPWDGRVEYFRAERPFKRAGYERLEFAVSPFVPVLDYLQEKTAARKTLTAPPRWPPQPTRAPASKLPSPARKTGSMARSAGDAYISSNRP
jgi:hypothetical protein